MLNVAGNAPVDRPYKPLVPAGNLDLTSLLSLYGSQPVCYTATQGPATR